MQIQPEKGQEGAWVWNDRHGYWILIQEGYRLLVVRGGGDWGAWVRPPGLSKFGGGRQRFKTDDKAKKVIEKWMKSQLATT